MQRRALPGSAGVVEGGHGARGFRETKKKCYLGWWNRSRGVLWVVLESATNCDGKGGGTTTTTTSVVWYYYSYYCCCTTTTTTVLWFFEYVSSRYHKFPWYDKTHDHRVACVWAIWQGVVDATTNDSSSTIIRWYVVGWPICWTYQAHLSTSVECWLCT